jgi:uncharacterized protein YjiS (DUF1127 family)
MSVQSIDNAWPPSGTADALARGGRGLLRRAMERFRAFRAARAFERECRESILELRMLDDRMLADMGLTRGEIASVVRHGHPLRG